MIPAATSGLSHTPRTPRPRSRDVPRARRSPIRSLTLVLVFGALLPLVKPDPAPAAVYEIWGYGNTACGRFMETYSAHLRGQDASNYSSEISWMQGFLTAQNADWAALMAKRFGSQNVKPQNGLFFGPDVEALGGWMNAYCNAHPLT